jgi:hypothetical protein
MLFKIFFKYEGISIKLNGGYFNADFRIFNYYNFYNIGSISFFFNIIEYFFIMFLQLLLPGLND